MLLNKFVNLPPRKRMGIVAILLGILAIFAGSPYDKTETKINVKELSLISADQISNVDVNKLADDILKSKYDYRLIDLRKSSDYEKYNIPSSENIKVENILNSDLARNENIILYSDNDIDATRAWFLLKSNNYAGVSILKGGINNWRSEVLFPVCNCGNDPSTEQLHKHNKLKERSAYFGGSMQNSSVAEKSTNYAMPEIQTPKKVTLKKSSGKKKREGC